MRTIISYEHTFPKEEGELKKARTSIQTPLEEDSSPDNRVLGVLKYEDSEYANYILNFLFVNSDFSNLKSPEYTFVVAVETPAVWN